MNRDEIYAVIKKNVMENFDELQESEIDPKKSMRDYGANSLDIIEVVSCSMRELNIKIPRSKLADVKTIDDLVNKFLENSSAKAVN